MPDFIPDFIEGFRMELDIGLNVKIAFWKIFSPLSEFESGRVNLGL